MTLAIAQSRTVNTPPQLAPAPVPVRRIPVSRIRPEDGLGRKRDREGHRELQRSIEQFGVLTPITVRAVPDGSGDYLLVKGQGRTLACGILGIETIPAIVVNDDYSDDEKVQQFLVENVARLKMRPVDRALLIHRARQDGEETAAIAKRFGVSPATVRRLLAQLEGASGGEMAALRAGDLSLSLHAVIARHVGASERPAVVSAVTPTGIRPRELEALFIALGWRNLVRLGDGLAADRLILLGWACSTLQHLPPGSLHERFGQLALQFPKSFTDTGNGVSLEVR